MKFKGSFAALLVLTVSMASAQNSQVMYFMNLPQNHFLNPAIRPANSLYIGLPVLTGVNLNISNNYLSFSDLITNGVKLSKSSIPILNPGFDVEGFLSRIKEKNYFETEASIQFLGAGFYAGRDLYLFIDVTGHVEGNIVIPRDMLRLALKGNQEFPGQTFDFTSFRADAKYYNELGCGFSKNVTQRLRIGAKGKLLFGVAEGSIVPNSLKLTVNNDYSNTLYSDVDLNVTGPFNFYVGSDNLVDSARFNDEQFKQNRSVIKYMTGFKNKGVGLDVGAEYEINDRFSVSASVTDLGFINWKKDLSRFKTQNIIKLDGKDIADIYTGTTNIDSLGKSLADSLKQSLMYVSGRSFREMLPVGFTVAGRFNLTNIFSFGVLSYSQLVDKQLREAVTLSANMNLGSVFSASLAYTASNSSYSNLGAGMLVRAGFAQFYFLVDRIPLSWSKVNTGDHKIPVPSNWNTLNTWFGMNFVFGYNARKENDKPMVSDNL